MIASHLLGCGSHDRISLQDDEMNLEKLEHESRGVVGLRSYGRGPVVYFVTDRSKRVRVQEMKIWTQTLPLACILELRWSPC